MRVNPGEFLDEPEELHALVIGLCEVICPWPPRQPTIDAELAKAIWTEYHYYLLGRALGIFAWLGIAAAVKAIFT
jgi:hypothetical protein